MIVTLDRDSEKGSHKIIRKLAWELDPFKSLLADLLNKHVKYFKIEGVKDNIQHFKMSVEELEWNKAKTLNRPKFSEFIINPSDKEFEILKKLVIKFVYVEYSEEIGYFEDIKETIKGNLGLPTHIINYKVYKKKGDRVFCDGFEGKIGKYYFDKYYKFQKGDAIPLRRDLDNMNLYIDYNELNKIYSVPQKSKTQEM